MSTMKCILISQHIILLLSELELSFKVIVYDQGRFLIMPRCFESSYVSNGFEVLLKAYSLMHKKPESSIFKNCISEMFRKQLYFFTWILPDYVFHESPKEFWKNNQFEHIRASFLRRCQNSLWQTSHEMMHFQAW